MKTALVKLGALILSLTMAISLFGSATIGTVAESNVIYVDQSGATEGAYTTFAEAVTAATKGSSSAMGTTIMLKSDYTTEVAIEVSKQYITIDLGRYTFTVAGVAQGLNIKSTGVVVQNGKVVLNAKNCSTNAYYGIYNAASGQTLTVKNIEFEHVTVKNSSGTTVYDGAGANNPGAVLRNITGTNSIINAYDCSFVYSGTYDYTAAPLVACNTATMNLYNCTFDGNGKMSGVQVRGNDGSTSQYAQLSIYNCTFNNVKNLFGLSTARGLSDPTTRIPIITIYGMTVNNAAKLKARDNYEMTFKDKDGNTLDFSSYQSPYTFKVACAHKYVDGVCAYCKAPESASSDPVITMDTGAAMRIDNTTKGIRFSATVDKDALDNFSGTITDAGILVAKEAQASESTLTVENSETVTSSGVSIGTGKVVAARYNGITFKAVPEANKYVIYGSLVEISETNANQKFVARAFIQYTDTNGETAYLYSNLSDARSIVQVAKAIQTNGDGYYSSLCQTHKDVVDYWANK